MRRRPKGLSVASSLEWTPRLDAAPSESGCWKHWDTEDILRITLRVEMEDGRTKYLTLRLDSETKTVTLAEGRRQS